MNIIYFVVALVCFNGECEEYIVDQHYTMQDCLEVLPKVVLTKDVQALSCERTIITKG